MLTDPSLSDLVDFPMERLHVEYKAAIDLREVINKAKLARHICALANHGGGYIVFGINDDYSPTGKVNPFPFTQDDISGICKKYLEPGVQCELWSVVSKSGNKHEIILVPPHGSSPVCANANGPEIKGKISGIIAGMHYTRKIGPESAAIASASHWAPIIRRCAMHEKTAILAALGAIIDGNRVEEGRDSNAELSAWNSPTIEAFKSQATSASPLDLQNNYVKLSYLIETSSGGFIDPRSLLNTLREISFEVERFVQTGWGMFYVFDRPPIWPTWTTDTETGLGEEDFLQASMLLEESTSGCDVWRVSPKGLATVIREYWEDFLPGRPPRSLEIYFHVRSIAEIILHANSLATRLPDATSIYFQCEWVGLNDRQVSSTGVPYFKARPASVDVVKTSGNWAVGTMLNDLEKIISALTGRLGRAFNVDISPDWIEATRNRWRRD